MPDHRTWILGRSPACDIVVAQDSVSFQHCRLTTDGTGWILEDLGSTNKTFVDGTPLTPGRPVAVSRNSRIMLGHGTPMPWPETAPVELGAPGARVISIGRAPENDVVVDLPMVSWHHARIVDENGQLVLEDTNSLNGVSLNHVENRIRRAAIKPSDEIYLGSYKISASQMLRKRKTEIGEAAQEKVNFSGNELIIGRDPSCDQPLDYPMISWRHAKLTRTPEGIFVEDLGSRNGTFVNGSRIATRVRVNAGDQIGLGSFRFQLQDGSTLVRREYHGNVTIEASGVGVLVDKGRKRILEPVSFTIYPSELVALMGPSGAGKTTLLKALNGYAAPSEGTVMFNGASLYDYYDLFRLQMGYVPQDDIVHPQLTIAEALRFSVKLRTDLSDKEIDERIEKVLRDLSLYEKKDEVIGSPERKVLSGGQRKRVNIALELIHDTPVLFLDEPTSGLSSYDAESVVRLLKRLSREGKTIITTIHQPSLNAFREFDDLIMLTTEKDRWGAMAYFGPAYPDSILFFNKRPAIEAAGETKRDLSPEMLLSGLETQNTAAWQSAFRKSPYQKQFVDDRIGTQPVRKGEEQSHSSTRPFDLRQWVALTHRNALCKLRDRAQTAILLLQAPLFAALVVAVIRPLTSGAGAEPEDLTRKLTIMHFLMVVAAIWFGCNNAARDIVGEWAVYQRERMVSLKLPSYIFSKLAVLFVVGVFQSLVMLAIVYYGCDQLRGRFWVEAGVLLLSTMIGASIGLCLSARASTTESAIALLPVVLLPVIALGGGLQPTYRLPQSVQWITAVVPSRWAFEANLVEEGKNWPGPSLQQQNQAPMQKQTPAPCPKFPEAVKDAVQPPIPDYYLPKDGNCAARPAQQDTPNSRQFRPTLVFCLTVLAGMLVALILASLTFLRMRDIQ